MADLLTLEPVVLPPHSVFVGHGYLQHAGAEYLGQVNLRYHVYLSPEDLDLQDSISFAYQWSLKTANDAIPEDEPAQGERVTISVVVPED